MFRRQIGQSGEGGILFPAFHQTLSWILRSTRQCCGVRPQERVWGIKPAAPGDWVSNGDWGSHLANLLHPPVVGMAFSISFCVLSRLDAKNCIITGLGCGKLGILLYSRKRRWRRRRGRFTGRHKPPYKVSGYGCLLEVP
jgi:hypothetical protein